MADLKLAVTEAAGEFVAEDEDTGPGDAEDATPHGDEDRVDFSFRLEDDRLVMELAGTAPASPAVEQELSHAIIEATVDRWTSPRAHRAGQEPLSRDQSTPR